MLMLNHVDDVFGKRHRAIAAVLPVRRDDTLDVKAGAEIPYCGVLGVGIRKVMVDRYGYWYTKVANVADVLTQVLTTCPNGVDVFLAEICFRDAAVHLQCLRRCHENDRIGMQARLAALDIEEFFGAKIGPEAGFGDDIVG